MGIIRDAIDLILPPTCALCGRNIPDDGILCNACKSSIIPLPPDRRWYYCLSEPYKGDICPDLRLYMPFVYDDFWAEVVHRIKFKGQDKLAIMIGEFMADIMAEDGFAKYNFDAIIPVPLSRSRLKERGYNQALKVAEPIANRIGVPLLDSVLIRSKDTLRQSNLTDNTERSLNITNAFEVVREWDITNMKILLVDDVATTGQTMHEAASVLLDNGAYMVVCVAICGNRAVKNQETY